MAQYVIDIDDALTTTLVRALDAENLVHPDAPLTLETYLVDYLQAWLDGLKSQHYAADVANAAQMFLRMPPAEQAEIRAKFTPK